MNRFLLSFLCILLLGVVCPSSAQKSPWKIGYTILRNYDTFGDVQINDTIRFVTNSVNWRNIYHGFIFKRKFDVKGHVLNLRFRLLLNYNHTVHIMDRDPPFLPHWHVYNSYGGKFYIHFLSVGGNYAYHFKAAPFSLKAGLDLRYHPYRKKSSIYYNEMRGRGSPDVIKTLAEPFDALFYSMAKFSGSFHIGFSWQIIELIEFSFEHENNFTSLIKDFELYGNSYSPFSRKPSYNFSLFFTLKAKE